jgi:PAS domain S-box-containing protein
MLPALEMRNSREISLHLPEMPLSPRLSRPPLLRYGVAILAIAAAIAARLALDPLLGDLYPFATLFFGVLFGAWYGGFGPALVAAALGGIASVPFLLPPRGSVIVNVFEHQVGLVLYFTVSLGIALLGKAMQDAQEHAERLAQEALRREEQIRATLASVGDAVIVTDAQGIIVALNSVAEKLTRWKIVDAVGRPVESVYKIVNERSRNEVASPTAASLHAGREGASEGPILLIAGDGTEGPIDDSAAAIKDDQGRVRGAVLVFRDVSERRRSERELQESEERFRLMANTAPVLIWMAGSDGKHLFFNRPWLDFTGRTFEQERGAGWLSGVHDDDRDRCLSTFAAAFDIRRPFQMEYRLRRADGEYRWLLDSGVPRQSYDGTFAGYIGSCIDVTDRKVLEHQLQDRIRELAQDNLRTQTRRTAQPVPGRRQRVSGRARRLREHPQENFGPGRSDVCRLVHRRHPRS